MSLALRPLIVLFLATSVSATSTWARCAQAGNQPEAQPLCASDDDRVENDDGDGVAALAGAGEQRPLNVILFEQPGPRSVEELRESFRSTALIKIESINLACGLTAEQKRKLQLASEGDIKRLVDRIEDYLRNLRLAPNALIKAQPVVVRLRDTIAGGPFQDDSLLTRTLARVMTAEQRTRCDEFGGLKRLHETIRMRCLPESSGDIKDIWLTASPFGDDNLQRLGALTSIQRLFLDSTQITDQGLIHVARLTKLEELDLERTRINGSGLADFRDMPRLRLLKLGYTQANDECLARLHGLTGLRTLKLEQTKITDRGLENLRLLPQLQILSVYETNITDTGLAAIAALHNLRELDLEATRVTDMGLVHLVGLPNLQVLDLRRTKISDAGLEHLQKLTNLRRLWLGNTAVTEAGVAKLRRALHRLTIRM